MKNTTSNLTEKVDRGSDGEIDQKKPPGMRRLRPSEIRRHGFGSPEGMEMTDMPARRPAIESEGNSEQPLTALSPTPSIAPLETASTMDSTPPSEKVARLVSSAVTPAPEEMVDSPRPSPTPSPSQIPKEEETPKKLRKRRLFFTPSRRKSKNTPSKPTGRFPSRPQQQSVTMPSPIPQDRITSPSGLASTRPTDTPQPTSQLGSPAPLPQSKRPSSGRRRRQTGAPMPSGLSGFTTPRSGRRRKPPGSSGRRGFNPLERISDIFSPQTPNFSPTSPIEPDVPDDGLSDSSFSEESSSGSVKEPFAEQVARLSQLLATPSQQLGDLALTTGYDDDRSDDDLDDEMMDLEASRRLLADELAAADFSLLDRGSAIPETPTARPEGISTTISPSPSPRRKEEPEIQEEDIDWVPLLQVEARHPPNFSISILEEPKDATNTGQSALPATAIFTPRSPQSTSVSRDPTVYMGDEFYSPTEEIRLSSDTNVDDDNEEEDKKPAAKDYSSPERKKAPPDYPIPDLKKTPPEMKKQPPEYPSPDKKGLQQTIPPEVSKKKLEGKKYSPFYTPPRPLPESNEESKRKFGKKYSPLYTPPRSLSAGKEKSIRELDALARGGNVDALVRDINKREEEEELYRQREAERRSPSSTEDPSLSTPQMDDDETNLSDEGWRKEATSPESIPFDPYGLGPRPEALLSSSISDLGESSNFPPSPEGKDDDIFQAFLSFAKRFTGDGRTLASDLTPTKNIEHPIRVLEHLNAIFPQAENEYRNTGEESLPDRIEVPTNMAVTVQEETPIKEKEKDEGNDIFVTPPRDREPTEEVVFELARLRQDSQDEQSDTQSQEAIPLLEKTKTASKGIGSRPSAFQETPAFVPIISDDSDNDIVFQKESQRSLGSHDISKPAPGESQIEPSEPELIKNNERVKRHNSLMDPSEWKQKKWLFALAVTLLITGIGLLIGTALFPTGVETPAPSPSVTFSPTQGAMPSLISFVPSHSLSTSSIPSFLPSAQTPKTSFFPTKMPTSPPSLRPSNSKPMPPKPNTSSPFVPRVPIETFSPSSRPSMRPTAVTTAEPTARPTSPFVTTPIPSTASPTATPSEGPSDLPSLEESEFRSMSPSMSPVSVPSVAPSSNPSTRTPMPSKEPSEEPSVSPTKKESEIPSFSPSISPVPAPSFLPTRMPTLPPSPKPTVPPIQIQTPSPTMPRKIIYFVVSYRIFIFNDLVEFVPESKYIPDLIDSMNLLTDDILLNIAARNKAGDDSMATEVVLPTSIIELINTECPDGVSVENSLCQEITAEISLLNGEESWRLFKDTTELAIRVGRLQYHLERVNENSPVEIIDSGWKPPNQGAPVDNPSSAISIPISEQRLPTPRPTFTPTPFSLLNFLESKSFDDGVALNDISSPQHRAYSWLRDNERIREYSEEQMLQRFSMATLYFATNGNQWLNNTLWMSDVSECTWFGKTGSEDRCNNNGELMHLELDLNNLSGSLPPELGLLSSALETVTLNGGPNSKLTGTLPTELGYLTRLKTFVGRNNDLSGSIPSEIGNWPALTQIDLSQNRFRGEFPTQIGNLSELTFFQISNNMFSGSLPSEVGQLRKCQKMFFEGNAFVSPIPTEIEGLNDLVKLKGGSNKFDSLPTELGMLKPLDFISFENCGITGQIPTELGNLRNLLQLKLENNDLGGNIPPELAMIKTLQILNLSNNQFSGPLPTELGSLVDLRIIKLNNNFLSGVIPSEVSELMELTTIQLNSNDFSGTIPSAVCETFNATFPAFQADCIDFDDNCPCCTICCVEDDCSCRYLGTPKEFLCFQNK